MDEEQFQVDHPNAVWVTEITYIRTWEGWLFATAVVQLLGQRSGRVLLQLTEARADLFDFIEMFHNPKRCPSGHLAAVSPNSASTAL